MKRFALAVVALLVASTLTTHSYANTGPGSVPWLSGSANFVAPLGFQIFCLQNASYCRGGGSSEVTLTQSLLTTIMSVNSSVNRSIRPTSERQDVWQLGVSRGDCEDYVLAKRAELIGLGVPGAALRIAAVKTPQGVGHAVLVVRTNGGDLVLDNLTSQIKRSDQVSHRWVAMTSADGRKWKLVRHS